MESLKGNGVFRMPLVATLMAVSGLATGLHAQSTAQASRSGLRYASHFISCHSTQVHWRQQSTATDLKTLHYRFAPTG